MFENYISNIKNEFENRFQNSKKYGEIFTFVMKLDETHEKNIDAIF